MQANCWCHTAVLEPPLITGAYSYFAVGNPKSITNVLAEPVGRLLFAGEATSSKPATGEGSWATAGLYAEPSQGNAGQWGTRVLFLTLEQWHHYCHDRGHLPLPADPRPCSAGRIPQRPARGRQRAAPHVWCCCCQQQLRSSDTQEGSQDEPKSPLSPEPAATSPFVRIFDKFVPFSTHNQHAALMLRLQKMQAQRPSAIDVCVISLVHAQHEHRTCGHNQAADTAARLCRPGKFTGVPPGGPGVCRRGALQAAPRPLAPLFRRRPGRPRRAAPCPPAAPGRRRRRWRCGTSARPGRKVCVTLSPGAGVDREQGFAPSAHLMGQPPGQLQGIARGVRALDALPPALRG